MTQRRALIGCERSGNLRRAMRAAGWDAWSCDLEPADDGSEFHICGDVRAVALLGWDFLFVHPPCTYLSVSGIHWNARRPERAALTEAAVDFARECFALVERVGRGGIENPVSILSTRIRRPDQIIQPYYFGADASKATCLWLHWLPPLALPPRDQWAPPRYVNGRPRWSNQTDSGQNRLAPSANRAAIRARTYPEIAAAMAAQWTRFLLSA